MAQAADDGIDTGDETRIMFEQIKTVLRDYIGLPPWSVLAAVGLVAFLALNALLRKPLTSGWGLLAPLAIGIVLESYEIRVQYREVGLFAPGNDPLLVILARHGLDVLIMLAIPAVVVAIALVNSR